MAKAVKPKKKKAVPNIKVKTNLTENQFMNAMLNTPVKNKNIKK